MIQVVIEKQRRALLGDDGEWIEQPPVRIPERGAAAAEPVVQIDPERILAPLAVLAFEVSVLMPVELLARILAIEPQPLIEADRGPTLERERNEASDLGP